MAEKTVEAMFGNVKMAVSKDAGIMKHALCRLHEIVVTSKGHTVKATKCLDHGLLMIWRVDAESEEEKKA